MHQPISIPSSHDVDQFIGWTVSTGDDQTLGTIAEVCHPPPTASSAHGCHYFRVAPGTLLRLLTGVPPVIVPDRLIHRVDPTTRRVLLAVPKTQVTHSGWVQPCDETYQRD